MNKMLRAFAVAAMAAVMALGVGCASQGTASSSASGSSAGSSSSASAASTASASSSSAAPSGSSAADEVAPGTYSIAVTLEGGTGKATVDSPAELVVADDGTMTATIVWSSPNYDQMVIDGVQYLPVNTSGNSTFEIPVAALDEDLPVQAETTAMSEPHMIDYTLHFDSSTLA